ncbi:copper chaperone PCu(A)C, partial [Mesorhizobium sp. M1D.F.Ca.ET.234.01.1.1]
MFNLLSKAQAFALRSAPTFHLQQRVELAVLALLLLFACVPAAIAHEFKVGDLEIEHPWSRATPAGAKVAGGYFTIINKGSSPDRLLA